MFRIGSQDESREAFNPPVTKTKGADNGSELGFIAALPVDIIHWPSVFEAARDI
jgi:hypothetical protein